MKIVSSPFILLIIFGVLMAGIGCTGSNNNSNSAPPPSGPSTLAPLSPVHSWSLINEKLRCAAPTEPAFCKGFYGFTVYPDGTFAVGPDAQGKIARGVLNRDEFASVAQNAENVGHEARISAECVDPTESVAGDQIDLGTPDNGPTYRIYENRPGSHCYLAPQQDVEAVHTALLALLQKYYPTPYPAAVRKGQWGGDEISLNVTENGARFKFKCFSGTLAATLEPDQNNEFFASGSFTSNVSTSGTNTNVTPAQFHGSIHGQTMTLNIQATYDNGAGAPMVINSTFTLNYGQQGRFGACKY